MRHTLALLASSALVFAPLTAQAQSAPATSVNILTYVPSSEWPNIANCTSTLDITPYKELADQAAVVLGGSPYGAGGHGTVEWGAGCFAFAGSIPQDYPVVERGAGAGVVGSPSSTYWKVLAPSTPGLIIHSASTADCHHSSSPPGSGQGAIIDGIEIDGAGGAPDATSHGIVMCVSAKLTNFVVRGFAGDGVNIDSTGGFGTADQISMSDGYTIFNGRYAFYAVGADSNAGVFSGVHGFNNGGGCKIDNSFLGNTWVGGSCQGNATGLTHANVGSASYQCLDPAACVTTSPTGNPSIWYPVAYSSAYPAWTSGQPYIVGSAHSAGVGNGNTKARFVGVYAEDSEGVSDVRGPAILDGNVDFYTSYTVKIAVASDDAGQWTVSTGAGGRSYNPSGSGSIISAAGGDNFAEGTAFQTINTFVNSVDKWRIRWVGTDLRCDWWGSDTTQHCYMTSSETTQTWGRPTAQPNNIGFQNGIWLGGPGRNVGSMRYVGFATSAPAASTLAIGDHVLNMSPAETGTVGSKKVLIEWVKLTTGVVVPIYGTDGN